MSWVSCHGWASLSPNWLRNWINVLNLRYSWGKKKKPYSHKRSFKQTHSQADFEGTYPVSPHTQSHQLGQTNLINNSCPTRNRLSPIQKHNKSAYWDNNSSIQTTQAQLEIKPSSHILHCCFHHRHKQPNPIMGEFGSTFCKSAYWKSWVFKKCIMKKCIFKKLSVL